jgi:hypothetical protein
LWILRQNTELLSVAFVRIDRDLLGRHRTNLPSRRGGSRRRYWVPVNPNPLNNLCKTLNGKLPLIKSCGPPAQRQHVSRYGTK